MLKERAWRGAMNPFPLTTIGKHLAARKRGE